MSVSKILISFVIVSIINHIPWLQQAFCLESNILTGTYSNMYFNKEGGDLVGKEIKIVITKKGVQGVLQFADGGPSELIVVNVSINADKIYFVIPDNYQDAGRFEGTITKKHIKGKFFYQEGGEEEVNLKKQKSYWD